MVLHIFFYVAIYVFYFRKHLEQRGWGKEFPLLISTDEKVQEENDQHKLWIQEQTGWISMSLRWDIWGLPRGIIVEKCLKMFLFNRVHKVWWFRSSESFWNNKTISLPGKHRHSLVDDSVWKLIPREQFRGI